MQAPCEPPTRSEGGFLMGKVRERLAGGAKRLGTYAGFVANGSTGGANEPADVLRRRFRLLDVARRLLPEDKALNSCMRVPVPFASGVKVMHDPGHGSAGFRGVCRCANGKICPACAAHLGEKKRAELAAGVGVVILVG